MTPLDDLGGGTWRVDAAFSSVTFSVRHLGIRDYRVGFRDIAGTLDADAGTLELSVALDSLDLNQPDIRARLLSDEFLDAAAHPEVRFVAAAIGPGEGAREGASEGARDVAIDGDLSIHGITRAVTAAGRIGVPGPALLTGLEQVTFELQATIERRDFGIDWQEEQPGGGLTLSHEVTIDAVLEFAREG